MRVFQWLDKNGLDMNMKTYNKKSVVPAKADILSVIGWSARHDSWFPAFAGSNRMERFKLALPGPQGEEQELGVMTCK